MHPSLGMNANQQVLRALDRPALTALDLARRPWIFTLSPALVGLFLVAAACALAEALARRQLAGAPRLDVLRAALEAMVVVVPGALVLATFLRLRVRPRMLLGSVSTGLLLAGVIAVCMMPLVLFLSLVSSEAPSVMIAPAFLVPALSLAIVATAPLRMIDVVDDSAGAWLFGRGFVAALVLVFFIRVHSFLPAIF